MKYLVVLLAFIAAACGSSDRKACDPGQQQQCTCDDGALGDQSCLPDLSGWTECECSCQANCAGRQCGDDGCGGSCGDCNAGQQCVNGQCEDVGCSPSCDPASCEICQNTSCVSTCTVDQQCVAGVCEDVNPCNPACDPTACEVCQGGTCVSTCTVDEQCLAGVCQDTGCIPACDSSACEVCQGNSCVSSCNATLCESCQGGACASDCTLDQQCVAGVCQDLNPCTPPCDSNACEVCQGGSCVSICTVDQQCVIGVCQDVNPCNPACDPNACEVCQGGACVSTCTVDQQCLAGVCQDVNPCDPVCDPNACQVCLGGVCESTCSASLCESCQAGTCASDCTVDQQCLAGVCQDVNPCDPVCDPAACQVCQGGTCVSTCTGNQTCQSGVCIAPLTVYDIQDPTQPNHPAEGSAVELSGVVVTAIDTLGSGSGRFWVQEPAGGPYSGILVYNGIGTPITFAVGDTVDVTGTYIEYNDLSEITLDSVTATGTAGPPAPELVQAATVASGGQLAEQYEGVLVQVEDVTVSSQPDQYSVFTVSGGLDVDDELYHTVPEPFSGLFLLQINGVMTYTFGGFKLLPRDSTDVVFDSTCSPACSTSSCEVCSAGTCTSYCTPPATCDTGVCVAPLTVYDVQDEGSPNHPTEGTYVVLSGVVVTAVDLDRGSGVGNFWVQESPGGPFSGLYVYNGLGATPPAVGDVVTVEGTFQEYFEVTEIDLDSLIVDGTAIVPAPEFLNPADVATGGALAEAYEGVLIGVRNVIVTDENPDLPDYFGQFLVTGGLMIDDWLYNIEPDPVLNDTFTSLVGVLHYGFDNHKLLPRVASDVVY